jgi:hypothetical protein
MEGWMVDNLDIKEEQQILDAFGGQQGFYKGYLLSTGERYETANWNKSGMATVPGRL